MTVESFSYAWALKVAEEAARGAEELLRQAAGKIPALYTKSCARDFVTEWDLRSEKVIVECLQAANPGIPILAEEGSGSEGQGNSDGLRWLVDPIDGTVNFSHGLPFFAVSIALEEKGEPVAGVVIAPALGWKFTAAKGMGARFNGEPMGVSNTGLLSEAALASGFPYHAPTSSHNYEEWEHFQRRAGACRRFGAAALDLCMVAQGWLDGYWESELSPWDLAAGALMVQEAGGQVTGLTGAAFSSQEGHILASNAKIHDEILRELAVLPTSRSVK